MLIKKAIIENFRQFGGRQEMNFSIDPKRNINIVLGKNGIGKTVLFNAMKWCLFGTKNEQEDYTHDTLPEPNLSLSKNQDNVQETNIRVKMKILLNNKEYTVERNVLCVNEDGEMHVNFRKEKLLISPQGLVLPKESSWFFINDDSLNNFAIDFDYKKLALPKNRISEIVKETNQYLKKWDIKKRLPLHSKREKEGILYLSAPEKILLSLGIITALHKVLVPKSAFILDSVFGRVDTLTRESISRNLPLSISQLIMFVTDEEYLGRVFDYESGKEKKSMKDTIKSLDRLGQEFILEYSPRMDEVEIKEI